MADYGTYASVEDFKDRVNIGDGADDAMIRVMLESVSRAIDRWTHRRFFTKRETKFFDGQEVGGRRFDDLFSERRQTLMQPGELWVDDLLEVTQIRMDTTHDATYDTTFGADDFLLWPDNPTDFPKVRIDLDRRQGDITFWSTGQRAIEVTGTWGYGDGTTETPYADSGATATVGSTTATSLTVGSATLLEAGNTILINAEQMYVQSRNTTNGNATVVRGVNGTTAATHGADQVNVYLYPGEVSEAAIIGTGKMWRRKDTMFSNVISNTALGQVTVNRGLFRDFDFTGLLEPYRKRRVVAV